MRHYRILADHGVHNQQDFGGVNGGLHHLELLHQLLVHVEPAGGVDEHNIVAVLLGVLDARPGNVHRVNLAHLEHRNVHLLAHHL